MPTIRNTKKSLVECLSLKQESVKDKYLLERIGMNPTPSTELYDKLVKADSYWHKVDDFYFSFCPQNYIFAKTRSYYASRSTKNSWNLPWIVYYLFLQK